MTRRDASETLVMTATFRADRTPMLVVRDESERTLQYLCALVAWSRTARVGRIVFVENSNTRFDFAPVVRLLESAGKDVELLVFDGNKDVERFGKGYGEGEMLEYAFGNSRLLGAAPAFYKVTGRLFVSNFDALSEATTTNEAFRLKPSRNSRAPKVITTFYKCSRELFGERLLDAYRHVTDEEGHRIEQAYFHRLAPLDVPGFPVKPAIVGQQASTGDMYAPYPEDIVFAARSLLQTA